MSDPVLEKITTLHCLGLSGSLLRKLVFLILTSGSYSAPWCYRLCFVILSSYKAIFMDGCSDDVSVRG